MLSIMFCINHQQEVHAMVSVRDQSPFHMTRESNQAVFCYGPFTTSTPPEINWDSVFMDTPTVEELLEQEVDYPVE